MKSCADFETLMEGLMAGEYEPQADGSSPRWAETARRELLAHARSVGERLPMAAAAHIGMQVCAALDYAHALAGADGEPLNIVHRDVSPENIFVSWTGAVKLGDFGIALAEGRKTKTEAGLLKGKMRYVAP